MSNLNIDVDTMNVFGSEVQCEEELEEAHVVVHGVGERDGEVRIRVRVRFPGFAARDEFLERGVGGKLQHLLEISVALARPLTHGLVTEKLSDLGPDL